MADGLLGQWPYLTVAFWVGGLMTSGFLAVALWPGFVVMLVDRGNSLCMGYAVIVFFSQHIQFQGKNVFQSFVCQSQSCHPINSYRLMVFLFHSNHTQCAIPPCSNPLNNNYSSSGSKPSYFCSNMIIIHWLHQLTWQSQADITWATPWPRKWQLERITNQSTPKIGMSIKILTSQSH